MEVLDQLVRDPETAVRAAVAGNLNLFQFPLIIECLVKDTCTAVRAQLAKNHNIPVEILARLAVDEDKQVRYTLASNQRTPPEVLRRLVEDVEKRELKVLAEHIDIPPEDLLRLVNDPEPMRRKEAAEHMTIRPESLQRLIDEEGRGIRSAVAENRNTPPEILARLAEETSLYSYGLREKVARNKNTPASVLERLAGNYSPDVRKEVAFNKNTPPETLARLAGDSNTEVRKNAARNVHTHPEILGRLARNERNEPFVYEIAKETLARLGIDSENPPIKSGPKRTVKSKKQSRKKRIIEDVEVGKEEIQFPLLYRYKFADTHFGTNDFIFNVALGGGVNHDILAVANHQDLNLFDITNREIIGGFDMEKGRPRPNFVLSWSPNGRYLLCADGDCIRRYNLVKGSARLVGKIKDYEGPVHLCTGYRYSRSIGAKCVAWAPDSSQFALSDRIYNVHLDLVQEYPVSRAYKTRLDSCEPSSHDIEEGEAIYELPVLWHPQTEVVFIGYGNWAFEDVEPEVYDNEDYSTGVLLKSWNLTQQSWKSLGFVGRITWLEWHPTQEGVLLIGAEDGTLTFFNVNDQKILRSVKLVDVVMGIIPVPGTNFLFVIGSEGRIVLYDGNRDIRYYPWRDRRKKHFNTRVTVDVNGKTAIITTPYAIEAYDLRPLQDL